MPPCPFETDESHCGRKTPYRKRFSSVMWMLLSIPYSRSGSPGCAVEEIPLIKAGNLLILFRDLWPFSRVHLLWAFPETGSSSNSKYTVILSSPIFGLHWRFGLGSQRWWVAQCYSILSGHTQPQPAPNHQTSLRNHLPTLPMPSDSTHLRRAWVTAQLSCQLSTFPCLLLPD